MKKVSVQVHMCVYVRGSSFFGDKKIFRVIVKKKKGKATEIVRRFCPLKYNLNIVLYFQVHPPYIFYWKWGNISFYFFSSCVSLYPCRLLNRKQEKKRRFSMRHFIGSVALVAAVMIVVWFHCSALMHNILNSFPNETKIFFMFYGQPLCTFLFTFISLIFVCSNQYNL